MQRTLRIVIPVAILATGVGAWKWLATPVDPPQSETAVAQRLQTGIIELQRTDFAVILESQGTIRAHHTTIITSLVPGKIITIHPAFEDGAFFREGEVLAELDRADLQAAFASSEARLARAEAALAQEQARAKQAKLNWEEIGFDEAPSDLVLRVPQLKEAQANVAATKAEVDQAKRNLERASIRAPFDGRVKERRVGLGQTVSPGTPLGEVFATDFAELRLPLTPRQLGFVNLPSQDSDAPVPVTITDALGGPNPASWQARIVRTEGTLDESSRELFAIARIDDPFGIGSGKPPLRIGQPVRAAIAGIVLKDVFVLPRSALRGVNRIYLIDPDPEASGEHLGLLRRHDIQPVWDTDEVLVIRDGLSAGQILATTRLPYAPDGAPVEIVRPAANASSTPADATPNSGDS
jgi:RND family efflux transporter MFP subunit